MNVLYLLSKGEIVYCIYFNLSGYKTRTAISSLFHVTIIKICNSHKANSLENRLLVSIKS